MTPCNLSAHGWGVAPGNIPALRRPTVGHLGYVFGNGLCGYVLGVDIFSNSAESQSFHEKKHAGAMHKLGFFPAMSLGRVQFALHLRQPMLEGRHPQYRPPLGGGSGPMSNV